MKIAKSWKLVVVALMPLTAQAAEIAIDASQLSIPPEAIYITVEGVGKVNGRQKLRMADGTYPVTTGSGQASYGSFTVLDGRVSAVTGSVVISEHGMGVKFDTCKLKRVQVAPTLWTLWGLKGAMAPSTHRTDILLPYGDHAIEIFTFRGIQASPFSVSESGVSESVLPKGWPRLELRSLTGCDKVAPQVEIATVAEGSKVRGAFDVTVKILEEDFNSGECFLGDRSVGVFNQNEARMMVDSSVVVDGEASLRCVAKDRSGNTGSKSMQIRVENLSYVLSRSDDDQQLTLTIEGDHAAHLMTIADSGIQLALSETSIQVSAVRPSQVVVEDRNRNGTPDSTYVVDSETLSVMIKQAVATGAVRQDGSVVLSIFSGQKEIGSVRASVQQLR